MFVSHTDKSLVFVFVFLGVRVRRVSKIWRKYRQNYNLGIAPDQGEGTVREGLELTKLTNQGGPTTQRVDCVQITDRIQIEHKENLEIRKGQTNKTLSPMFNFFYFYCILTLSAR